jgi:hypothetical protein
LRVFDVGCGAGFLLDRLAKQGWVTAGCEPEERVARIARDKGHEVRAGLFAFEPGEHAQLVILGDVLEHQARPLEMLAAARAWLTPDGSPGGLLHVRVPDLEKVNFETFGDVFGLQHRVWFTTDTLTAMLARAGFRVKRLVQRGPGLTASAVCDESKPMQRAQVEPGRSIRLIETYARDMRARRRRISERLAALQGKRIALWGGGEHAGELLRHTSLGWTASLVVDRNPGLWEQSCAGHRISSPAELFQDPPDAVVIASKAYQESIAAELSSLAERGVEIVRLYEQGGHA